MSPLDTASKPKLSGHRYASDVDPSALLQLASLAEPADRGIDVTTTLCPIRFGFKPGTRVILLTLVRSSYAVATAGFPRGQRLTPIGWRKRSRDRSYNHWHSLGNYTISSRFSDPNKYFTYDDICQVMT